MRVSTSGKECPTVTKSWLIANQAIGAAAQFTIGPFAMPGATLGNTVLVVSADVALPATAGALTPSIKAVVTSDNNASIIIANASAAALVALGVDVSINVIALPTVP